MGRGLRKSETGFRDLASIPPCECWLRVLIYIGGCDDYGGQLVAAILCEYRFTQNRIHPGRWHAHMDARQLAFSCPSRQNANRRNCGGVSIN